MADSQVAANLGTDVQGLLFEPAGLAGSSAPVERRFIHRVFFHPPEQQHTLFNGSVLEILTPLPCRRN